MRLYKIVSVTEKHTGNPSTGAGAKHVGQLAQFGSVPMVGVSVVIDTPINDGFVTSRVEDVQRFGDDLEVVRITTANSVYLLQEVNHETL